MNKTNAKKAKAHLEKIKQLMSKVHSPYKGLTKQEIINRIRKTREQHWEETIAAHSR